MTSQARHEEALATDAQLGLGPRRRERTSAHREGAQLVRVRSRGRARGRVRVGVGVGVGVRVRARVGVRVRVKASERVGLWGCVAVGGRVSARRCS